MRTRFKLPLVGLPTCYYDFPKDDAGKVVKGHRGALRRLLEMELALHIHGKGQLRKFVW